MNRILFTAFIIMLFLPGCASKNWKSPLGEDETKNMREKLQATQRDLSTCPSFISTELTATWDSQLYDGGITGYLQLLLPTSIKVVAVNPLSQPLFALTTDGKKFEAINAVKGIYKHGRFAHLTERYNLPAGVLNGNWAEWLSARAVFTDAQLKELRTDVSSRGTWLFIEKNKGQRSQEYLLYDTSGQRILQRVPLNEDGNEIASITYNNWSSKDICAFPRK